MDNIVVIGLFVFAYLGTFITVVYGYGYLFSWQFGIDVPRPMSAELLYLGFVYLCCIVGQGIIANGTKLPFLGTLCHILDESLFFYRRLPLWFMVIFVTCIYGFILLGGTQIVKLIPGLTTPGLFVISVGFAGPAVSMFMWRLTHPKKKLTG